MHVGKTSALLLLIVVALWAAVPALACGLPSHQDDCCRQMMQDLGACNMAATQSCCQVHASESSVPVGRATPPERPLTLILVAACPGLQIPEIGRLLSSQIAAAAPPIPPNGSFVLRI